MPTSTDRRHKARELALQALFVLDAQGAELPALDQRQLLERVVQDGEAEPGVRARAIEMAESAWRLRPTADAWIERVAPQWPTRRQPAVDRNLLRLAVWELTSTDTPPKVVLDEAIELAKLYSTENSPGFINGVMDAILREHQALLTPPAEPAPPVIADTIAPA